MLSGAVTGVAGVVGQKSHLEVLEEHRKLLEKFGAASAAVSEEKKKHADDVMEEKHVKVEDPIDLTTLKPSDDDHADEDEQ